MIKFGDRIFAERGKFVHRFPVRAAAHHHAALDAEGLQNFGHRLGEFRACRLAAERLLDRAGPEDVMQRLAPLVSGDGPWRSLASEITGIAQIRAGRNDAARTIFTELSDDARAPNGVRSRAQELLTSLGGPLESEQPAPSEPEAQADGPVETQTNGGTD